MAAILIQFLFRLAFGISLALAATPARQVTSGFYKVHLWVVMGLATLAALVQVSLGTDSFYAAMVLACAAAAAVLSYAGAVAWLYEKRTPGLVLLVLVAWLAISGAWLTNSCPPGGTASALVLSALDPVTGGWLLGVLLTAMFLGHWYLNHPGMPLAPLQRLLLLVAGAILLRSLVCGAGLGLHLAAGQPSDVAFWLFLTLRWTAGLALTPLLAWLAWQTLKIPNTQSATGILYAAVILAFIGELTGQLLSSGKWYPL